MTRSPLFKKLFITKSDKLTIHLVRSIFASNISFVLDFGMLVLLTEVIHLHYLISNAVAFMMGTSALFLLSIYWVFSRRRVSSKHLEYWIFILIGAAGVGFNEVLIWYFTEHLHRYYLFSKIYAGCIVFIWNFATRKYILFR